MRLPLAALVLAAGFVAAPALAQDITAEPNYGTVSLTSGFTPDPHIITVDSGGLIDASPLGASCAGHISTAPDVRLNYTAGALPLIISAASQDDTTLVINGPDGSWSCDDDGGEQGFNPSIRFNNAQSGAYEIWIGSYSARTNSRARLHISETSSQ